MKLKMGRPVEGNLSSANVSCLYYPTPEYVALGYSILSMTCHDSM